MMTDKEKFEVARETSERYRKRFQQATEQLASKQRECDELHAQLADWYETYEAKLAGRRRECKRLRGIIHSIGHRCLMNEDEIQAASGGEDVK